MPFLDDSGNRQRPGWTPHWTPPPKHKPTRWDNQPRPTPTPSPTSTPATPSNASSTATPFKPTPPVWNQQGFSPLMAPTQEKPKTAGFEDFASSLANTESATGPYAAPPTPTDVVLQALQSADWKLPDIPKKSMKSGKSLFDKEDVEQLASFSYELAPQEWQLIKDTYSSKAAQSYGYGAPGVAAVPPTNAKPVMPVVKVEEQESGPMTWDAYNALSDDQRAAVDFNTLLVEARQSDLTTKPPANPQAKQWYDDKVTKMFGPTGGSKTYAPATVNLLDKLDFKATGQDLDEFLSLERAIDDSELKNFKLSDQINLKQLSALSGVDTTGPIPSNSALVPAAKGEYSSVRTEENVTAAVQTAVQKSKAFLDELFTNPANQVWDFSGTVQRALGTTTPEGPVPLGYGNPQLRGKDEASALMDGWLQDKYNQLSSPTLSDFSFIGEELNAYEFTPEERQYFFDYVDQRSRREDQHGPLNMAGTETQAATGERRSGAEIRKILGIGD